MKRNLNSVLLFLIFVNLLVSCGGGDNKQAEKSKSDTSGVDYSIPFHVKPVMNIPHPTHLEAYYSVNVKSDTVSNAQRDSINPVMIKLCDSLKNHWDEVVITVMKETNYTNALSREKGITDSKNPFYYYNVYLLRYTFRDKENIYVLKYDPTKNNWKE